MITVKNLEKSFGYHQVLRGIDQTIEQGEKVVVIGPSGSGKSTFLRTINRSTQINIQKYREFLDRANQLDTGDV